MNELIMKRSLRDLIAEEFLKTNLVQRDFCCIIEMRQPRLSDLLNQKYERFSSSDLIEKVEKLGWYVRFKDDNNRKSFILEKDKNKHKEYLNKLNSYKKQKLK